MDEQERDTQERAARKKRLADLLLEHRDLDDIIARLSADNAGDQVQMQRLKKRKLALKDQIERLRDLLLPDIIA